MSVLFKRRWESCCGGWGLLYGHLSNVHERQITIFLETLQTLNTENSSFCWMHAGQRSYKYANVQNLWCYKTKAESFCCGNASLFVFKHLRGLTVCFSLEQAPASRHSNRGWFQLGALKPPTASASSVSRGLGWCAENGISPQLYLHIYRHKRKTSRKGQESVQYVLCHFWALNLSRRFSTMSKQK